MNEVVIVMIQLSEFPGPNFEWESVVHQQRLYIRYWYVAWVNHHFIIDLMT